jgi:hypothetical protein
MRDLEKRRWCFGCNRQVLTQEELQKLESSSKEEVKSPTRVPRVQSMEFDQPHPSYASTSQPTAQISSNPPMKPPQPVHESNNNTAPQPQTQVQSVQIQHAPAAHVMAENEQQIVNATVTTLFSKLDQTQKALLNESDIKKSIKLCKLLKELASTIESFQSI